MNIDSNTRADVLDTIRNFKINKVPEATRFWMIRTKKGYFYHEFITKGFVALAWNTITSETSFADSHSQALNNSILQEYPEINRPKVVVNKCKNFIYDIQEGDILVIPSNGSQFITFAYAGKYYEEDEKTPEIEHNTIYRIEHNEVVIDEVSCPYKKRRNITLIRTIKSKELNYHLYKAISSYHGISNLDPYGVDILDHIYNQYIYKDDARLIFHVSKTDPITSKEFSGFLYSINQILSYADIAESSISTQASVHSVGDIVFNLKNGYQWLSDNYLCLVALIVVLGGGKFLTVQLPGVAQIIKDFLSIKTDSEKKQAELRGMELDNAQKELEIIKKLKALNIPLDSLDSSLKTLAECSKSMQIEPINKIESPVIDSPSELSILGNEEEMT